MRRGPTKGHYDRASIDDVLDRGLLAHVAFFDGRDQCCVPMLYARLDDRIYIHGSTASRMMRALARRGGSVCHGDDRPCARARALRVRALGELRLGDGVRTFEPIDDAAERLVAFEAFTEKLLPGRWNEVRQPNAQELKATAILAMEIDEASAKIRTGPPDDDDSPDAELDTWAGILPIVSSYGTPTPSPGLRPGITISPSVLELLGEEATE